MYGLPSDNYLNLQRKYSHIIKTKIYIKSFPHTVSTSKVPRKNICSLTSMALAERPSPHDQDIRSEISDADILN